MLNKEDCFFIGLLILVFVFIGLVVIYGNDSNSDSKSGISFSHINNSFKLLKPDNSDVYFTYSLIYSNRSLETLLVVYSNGSIYMHENFTDKICDNYNEYKTKEQGK